MQPDGANQHTQAPIVTGTSVIAIKFSEGVVIAADNLGRSSLPPLLLFHHTFFCVHTHSHTHTPSPLPLVLLSSEEPANTPRQPPTAPSPASQT